MLRQAQHERADIREAIARRYTERQMQRTPAALGANTVLVDSRIPSADGCALGAGVLRQAQHEWADKGEAIARRDAERQMQRSSAAQGVEKGPPGDEG